MRLTTALSVSGVTESLFIYFWVGGVGDGGNGGQTLIWGCQENGIAMIFFPISFIVYNQKSNGGGGTV